MSYRLTVHIDNVKKIRVEDGWDSKANKSTSKEILINTISIRNLKSKTRVDEELNILRNKYKISLGKDRTKRDKYGKELIYISNEK
jgi:hypothetical protein|tara:strand:- start:13 stop:270 length:258 start_codon:yes stop_codon:yes gene_type:complete